MNHKFINKFIIIFLFTALSIQLIAIDTPSNNFRHRINTLPSNEWHLHDVEAEILLGRKVAARILGQYKLYENDKIQRYINLIGQGIVNNLGRPEITYYFTVLDSDHINAYATPGGYIFITKGLLKKCKNEAQLIGVLAHEISHVNRRYIVQKYNIRGNKSSLLSYASIIAGASTQTARLTLNILLDEILESLLSKGLDKEEELQADKDAILYMTLLDYKASEYTDLMLSIQDKSDTQSMSTTHPTATKRINEMNSKITELGTKSSKIYNERFKEHVKL